MTGLKQGRSVTLSFSGLSAKCLFSQQAGTKAKSKRFILEFKLQLQVVLTITPKPVLDTAFLQYKILLLESSVLQYLVSTVKSTQLQVIPSIHLSENKWMLLPLYFTRR